MGAPTAGAPSRPVYPARIPWDALPPPLTTPTLTMGLYGPSRVTPFGVCSGPEKDRNVRISGGTPCAPSPDPSCQQHIPRHDGNSPGADGTQASIIKQPDKARLRRPPETQHRRRPEPQICPEVPGDLPHHPPEGQLSDEQRRASLVVANVFQSHSPCPAPVRFHQPPLHSCPVDPPLHPSVQSSTRRPSPALSLGQEMQRAGSPRPIGGQPAVLPRGSLRATIGSGGAPPPVLLRLLGSSSSPSSSRPRPPPRDPPAPPPPVLGPSPLPVPATSPPRPPAAGFLHGLPPPEPPAPPAAPLAAPAPPASSTPSLSDLSSSPQTPGTGTLCPRLPWKPVTNSPIWSALQPLPAKAFCKARVSPWLMKKAVKDSVVATWAGLAGRVRCICFFTRFGAPAPSAGRGALSSGVSSEEYSSTTFLSAPLPGGGPSLGAAPPPPITNGPPPVPFRAVCFAHAIQQGDPHPTPAQ